MPAYRSHDIRLKRRPIDEEARPMDFDLPPEITAKLAELDAFIEAEIKPLERENMQFFDHRRENARTDWEHDGRPRGERRDLISETEPRAELARHPRHALTK